MRLVVVLAFVLTVSYKAQTIQFTKYIPKPKVKKTIAAHHTSMDFYNFHREEHVTKFEVPLLLTFKKFSVHTMVSTGKHVNWVHTTIKFKLRY